MGQSAGRVNWSATSSGDDADQPEVIEAEIEQTRADLSATVEAIQQRLDPEQAKDSARELAEHVLQEAKEHAREIVHEAGEHAREVVKDATAHVQAAIHDATIGRVQHMVRSAHGQANEASESLMVTMKQNPIPTALAGLSLAWLWMNRRSSSAQRSRSYHEASYAVGAGYQQTGGSYQQAGGGYQHTGAGYQQTGGGYYRPAQTETNIAGRVGQAVGGAASQVGDTAGNIAGQVGSTASNLASTVGDTAGNVASAAGDTASAIASTIGDTASNLAGQVGGVASTAEDSFQHALRTNPLAVGAVAVAVGAAIGLMLPQTERENQLLGEARDNLVGKAQDLAQETMEKVQHVATEAQQTVQQEAEKQGLAQ